MFYFQPTMVIFHISNSKIMFIRRRFTLVYIAALTAFNWKNRGIDVVFSEK